MLIDETGVPIKGAVLKTTGDDSLDKRMLINLNHLRFKPFKYNGKAVESAVNIPIYLAVDTRKHESCYVDETMEG